MLGLLLTTLLWFKLGFAEDDNDNLAKIMDFNALKPFPVFETGAMDFQGILKREPQIYDTIPDDARSQDSSDVESNYEDQQTGHQSDDYDSTIFGGARRGSTRDKTLSPTPWKHESTDKMGCGNPVCVILDQKPRRFMNLCHFIKFLDKVERDQQMNFVQKGDCYDIIDNKEGATRKPWTSLRPGQYRHSCMACQKDHYCRKSVVLNIDIQSIFQGQSSAYGGETFNEFDNLRMPGIPLEFDNVCKAMEYISTSKNLNIKTQVIGFAVGKQHKIFPEAGDECLWTEWFDLSSPCLATGEYESYETAMMLVMEQRSGPLRICPASNVMMTEWEGGSEITKVSSEDCKRGQANGYNKTFGCNIKETKYDLKCINEENNEYDLPAPFKWPEDRNTNCLDFKHRYCCRSTDMYRPTRLVELSSHVKPVFPLGSVLIAATSFTNIKYMVANLDGTPKDYKCDITVEGSRATCNCKSKTSDTATAYIKDACNMIGKVDIIIKPDGSHHYTIKFDGAEITMEVELRQKYHYVTMMKVIRYIKNEKEVVQETIPHFDENGKLVHFVTTKQFIGQPGTITITTDAYDSRHFQRVGYTKVSGKSTSSRAFDKLVRLNEQFHFEYIIESPPLHHLFAECEWREWVNMGYPNDKDMYEFELKMKAQENGALRKHVCGNEISSVHYVDAVTVEKLVPWYELKQQGIQRDYEVTKLTPTFGYFCNDKNMPGNLGKEKCVDMKVRYCCAKQVRASWGMWETWSECSATCGGGKTSRTRQCMKSIDVDEQLKKCYGEENPSNKIMTKECNIHNCPGNMQWGAWGRWTQCSASCGGGTKQRKRTCFSATAGGQKCPHRVHQKKLYEEKQPCTRDACEMFVWGSWSAWTSCSNTCGEGKRLRKRTCKNNITYQPRPIEGCGSSSDAMQDNRCKLVECPVNGGWSSWTAWERCSQNCIYHPSSNYPNKQTKAIKKKRRYCTNPLPKYGGEKCIQNKQFKFDSNHYSEVIEKPCTLEDNIGYCPENCIFTEWGEWSSCSATCIHLNIKPGPMRDLDYGEGTEWPIIEPPPPGHYPIRQRYKTLISAEKFGGECRERNYAIFRDAEREDGMKGGFLHEEEECSCCRQYMQRNYYDHIKSEYNERLGCLGWCDISCKWNPPKVELQCEDINTLSKIYPDINLRKEGDYLSQEPCWVFPFASKSKRLKRPFPSKFNAYVRALKAYIRGEDVEANAKIMNKFDRTKRKWMQDVTAYNKLSKTVYKGVIEEPIYDPIAGGRDCVYPEYAEDYAGMILTRNETLLEDYDKYETVSSYERSVPLSCDPRICVPSQGSNVGRPKEHACHHFWTTWGPWSQCSTTCGMSGHRVAKRKCTKCGEANKPHNGNPPKDQCLPSRTFIEGVEGHTTERRTYCSPCPTDQYKGWADWMEWSAPDRTCGGGIKVSRTRKCNDDYLASARLEGNTPMIERCESNGGIEKDFKTINLPDCKNYDYEK